MRIAHFVGIDKNERLTIQPQATIILLFTYSIKPFLLATGKGESRLFAGFPAKRDICAANPATQFQRLTPVDFCNKKRCGQVRFYI